MCDHLSIFTSCLSFSAKGFFRCHCLFNIIAFEFKTFCHWFGLERRGLMGGAKRV